MTSAARVVDAGAPTVRAGDAGRREVARTAGATPRAVGPGHLGLQALPATLEVAQLALQVRLEPGAVLTLELLELLDVLLQRGALGVETAHGLLVALARVALERVG